MAGSDLPAQGQGDAPVAAAADAGGCADAAPTAAEVFQGLRDFRSLTRERSLASLSKGLGTGLFQPGDVEALVQEALSADAWEAKQGGLLAAAEAIRAWDRPGFRAALLPELPRLLQDGEYRVRKAVAAALQECCRRDGLSVYDALSGAVLGDIRGKFSRTGEAAGETSEAPAAPPSFLPDTEGWRSLETSMGALEGMMQGCGAAFTPRIDGEMLGLLGECSKHTNRFVREYAYFAFKNVFEVCETPVFLDSVAPQTVGLMAAGVRDNWSQVRYAASVAVRAFMEKAAEVRERFYPELLGPMCLNRHYVAEGVRLYSQETWRSVCGPRGGAALLMAHFDSVIDAYVAAAKAPNHAVREAACHCISELAGRVAGTPAEPTPHREHFTQARVERLLQALLEAFQDESWPVRDVASTALGHFVHAFPEHCAGIRPQLLDLWFQQMADNIPSLRKNGAAALVMAVSVWRADLWDTVVARMRKTLPEVLMQPENSEIFTDYTPSGPFSVPRSKTLAMGEKPDPAHTDQTMYSCGSVAPKTFKRPGRGRSDAGCMNCTDDQPHQLWEASEGMVHLLAELAALAARDADATSQSRSDGLAEMLPMLAQAFGCSQFRHHHLLKQRICERLPALTEALGPQRVLPHLPELLRITAECAAQGVHMALRECAREALAAWRRCLPAEAVETACRAAAVEPRAVMAA